MMKIFSALIVSALVSLSMADKCAPIAEAKVRSLWNDWNAALQTLDPQKVADMYQTDSVLLPTLSNQIRPDTDTKLNYFEHFLQKKPVGYIREDYVNIKGCNTAIYNGIYTFDLTAVGKKVDARFTYAYTYENGAWKIKSHHSSLMPEAPKRRSLRVKSEHEKSVELAIAPKSESCASIGANDVKQLWLNWNAELALLSPEKMSELYWNHGSILLPTLSNQVRDTKDEKIDYFEHFLKKKPSAVINQDFVSVGCNAAEYNGIYTFTLTNPDTQAVSEAIARFTYVFTTSPSTSGVWKIATHHSSLMPNPGGLSGSRRLTDFVEDFDRTKFSEDELALEVSFI